MLLVVVTLPVISASSSQAVSITNGGCEATYSTTSGSSNVQILESTVNGNKYCIIVFKTNNEGNDALVEWTAPAGVNQLQFLAVGGGGSGGAGRGGGGGAGELVESQINISSQSFLIKVGGGGAGVSSGQGVTGAISSLTTGGITYGAGGGGGGGSHQNNLEDGKVGGSGGGAGMNYANRTSLGGAFLKQSSGLGNAGGDSYKCATSETIRDKIRITGGGGGAGGAGGSAGNCAGDTSQFVLTNCTGPGNPTGCYGATPPNGGAGVSSALLSSLGNSFGYSSNQIFAGGGGGALGMSSTEYCTEGNSGQTGVYCSLPSGFNRNIFPGAGDRASGGNGGSGVGGNGAGVTGNGTAGLAGTGSGGGGTVAGTSGSGAAGVVAVKYLLPQTTLAAPTLPVATSQQSVTFNSNVSDPAGISRTKQWEFSSDGSSWSSVSGGSGANSDNYTTSTLTVAGNNAKFYRLKFTDTISVSDADGTTTTLSTTSVTSSALLTVNRASQSSLSLTSTTGTYLTNLRLLTSGGSDVGAVSFAVGSTGTAGCSISNSDSLTSTTAGTCQVVAAKAGTTEYLPAYDTQTVTLGKASLTLTISVSGSTTIKYGSSASSSYTTNRSLGTGNIANLTGAISYSTVNSTACSINTSSGVVMMIAASGTCSVRVSLASDSNYLDTNSTTVSLTPAKADTLTVTAGSPTLTYNGNSQTIPHSYSISGLQFSDTLTALSYNYTGTPNSGGGASGSANVDQAGVYTITPSAATISNSDSYTAVTYATGTLTVNRASRTIAGSAVGSLKYGSTATVSVTTTPTSSTDGSVTFSAGASSACSVVSGTGVTSMNRAAGTCSITPSITQGNNYLAATAASPVSITPAKADAISVTAGNATATYTGSSVSVSPTYSVSGLIGSDTVTVTYQYFGTDNSGGPYSLSSDRPTNAGTFAIVPVVSQPNSDSYTATATLVNGVLTVDRASRTLSATTYSASTLKYGASASVVSNSTTPSTNSDGVFSYAIGAGCSINSSTGVVTATTSSGTCSQTTTIGQGNNYLAAVAPSVSFTLSKADTLTVTSSTPAAVTFTGSAAAVSPSVTVTGLVNSDTASGATYNYSRSTTCATGGTCSVGDIGPAGGIVFYVSGSAINAADGISPGGIYLEAAPATFSKTPYKWCEGITNPYTTVIGGTATSIGSGALNTRIIAERCTGGAVFEAANLTFGSKSDWFLPSHSEQGQMYVQKSLIGFGAGTAANDYNYWGSFEGTADIAASLVPNSGVGGQNKADAIPYWPIRAFSPTATAYSSSTTAPTNAGTYVITPSSLTLGGGASVDNYVAIIYETSTVTINKANQSIFSNYGSLEAILGNTFTIYPFGGNGDGAVYLAISNGTATGCSAGLSTVTAATAGTCILTITKSANENYNQAQASFSIQFNYFVPAAAAPTSSRPTEIAIASSPAWSSTATAVPSITSFSPTSGPVGTVVTITGVGLDGVNAVRIGRRALTSVTGVSSTSVTAVIPAGAASGPLVVANSFGNNVSASSFTVTP